MKFNHYFRSIVFACALWFAVSAFSTDKNDITKNEERSFLISHRALREKLKSVVGAAAPGPIVNTTAGAVQGVQDEKYKLFLGIPFAAPPIGELRWKKPQPALRWNGVKQATWFGNSCPQTSAFTIFTEKSEDCLNLNIYTPINAAPGKNLPVIIFFYGGSWVDGAASFPLYWANQDITDVENVIWVTANYRLGIFGFLASEALRAESGDGSVGNYGFQDQTAVMQWVRDNIYNFGGNPFQVTIQGESAGAGSVSAHLISPISTGLFSRAIIESGPFAIWTAQPLNISVLKYNKLIENTGCDLQAKRLRGQVSEDPIVACLRSLNTSQLMNARHGLPSGLVEWSPVIDGVIIPDYPQTLAKEGRIANRVPVLLGSNHDEGTVFTRAPKDLNVSSYESFLAHRFTPELASKLVNLYPVENYTSPWWAVSHIIGDAAMSCPTRRTSRWLTSGSNAQPVYEYFYTHVLEVVQLFVPYKGCFHGSELAMVFDLELGLWTENERSLAKQFVRYWTRFAATGNPNGDSDPIWPEYSSAADKLLLIDTPTPTNASHVKNTLCDFWDDADIPATLVWGPGA